MTDCWKFFLGMLVFVLFHDEARRFKKDVLLMDERKRRMESREGYRNEGSLYNCISFCFKR